MAGEIGSFLGGLGGSTIGSAVVKLYLDSKAYQAEMATATSSTTASTGRMGKAMGLLKVAGPLAFAAVGAAAIKFGAASISAASNQEEALNKVKEIFDESTSAVEAFAESASTNLGISETAALSAAGTFGNLFTNVGFTTKAAADMSTGLVTLAADLSSFNNLDPTIALEKLRAGLAGEAEPLRAVGVFLSEAKVEAEAFASGIAETGAKLTDQQKIQARYNLILKETTQAQGDFARTSDSLANVQRRLSAEIEDAQATIGKELLPVVTDLVTILADLAPLLPLVVDGFRFMGSAAAEAVPHLGVLGDVLGSMGGSNLPQFEAGLKGVKAALDKGSLSASAAVLQVEELAEAAGVTLPAGAASMVEAMQRAGGAADEMGDGVAKGAKKAGRRMKGFFGLTGSALDDFSEDIRANFTTVDTVFSGLSEKAKVTAQDVITAFRKQNKALANYARNVRDVKQMGLEDDVLASLSTMGLEGATILQGLADSSKREISKVNATFDTNVARAATVTGSITGVKNAVRDLNGDRATAEVMVRYIVDPSGINPKDLPGLGN